MSHDPRLAECLLLQRAVAAHPTLAGLESDPGWPALSARLSALLGEVRRHAPAAPPAPPRDPGRVRLVQWNIEHGNWYERVERALREHPELAGADVVTLDEIDVGCARAGNRDVTRDLARALGLHGVWTALFLETTVGRDDDPACAAGRTNEEGLFGIAVLSRWPIGEVRRVELPSPRAIQFELERMVGGHAALIVEVLRPGSPFVVVAAHLEVHRTREHRADQMRAIVEALANERRPIVLAGDFNTHTFDRGLWHSALHGASALLLLPGPMLRARLLRPDRGPAREPLFAELRRGGFEWARFVDFAPTLQLRDDRLEELHALPAPVRLPARRVLQWAVHRGALRLDWICGRGWRAGRGRTVRGLDGPGRASDHAPITAELDG
ncbi:MAG TPA: endonuclease/exonuclease/phosphatase family protein [Candidatus Acidoferrales bacterium]|nr:endonuclease/exonuclease/phosphatase family protein [Candidatus Acidoferrales bacterium]